jgi:predicted nuclease of predicted toxin-antitoxin system
VRFVLDEDVDASLAGHLNAQGHEAWAVVRANLSGVADEVVAVYGHTKDNAIVVTHDAEFSRWRRKNCIGRHLFLDCAETMAAELLDKHLDHITMMMSIYDDLYCRVSVGNIESVWKWS